MKYLKLTNDSNINQLEDLQPSQEKGCLEQAEDLV